MMFLPPTLLSEADAVRPKTEARMRPGGGAARGSNVHDVPNPGDTAILPAIVARQTAITVPGAFAPPASMKDR